MCSVNVNLGHMEALEACREENLVNLFPSVTFSQCMFKVSDVTSLSGEGPEIMQEMILTNK